MQEVEALEMPWFPWWHTINTSTDAADPLGLQPDEGRDDALPWRALLPSPGSTDGASSPWHAAKNLQRCMQLSAEFDATACSFPSLADVASFVLGPATTLPSTADPAPMLPRDMDWQACYRTLDLPLSSPAALCLHFAASIVTALSLLADLTRNPTPHPINVLYLGPEAELHLLDTFTALPHLLGLRPGTQLHVHFIGPTVPPAWHAQTGRLAPADAIAIPAHQAHDSRARGGAQEHRGTTVQVSFWRGCLHSVLRDLADACGSFSPVHGRPGSPSRKRARVSGAETDAAPCCGRTCATCDLWQAVQPALAWAPNAGLVAYPSWCPTLRIMEHAAAPPFVFSDYGREALVAAQEMCAALHPGLECVATPRPNPLRQPWRRTEHGNLLPMYSNAFVMALAPRSS